MENVKFSIPFSLNNKFVEFFYVMQVYNLLRKEAMSNCVRSGTCGEKTSINDTPSRPVCGWHRVRNESPAVAWRRSVGHCLLNIPTMVGGVFNAMMRALWWPASRWGLRKDNLLISIVTKGMSKSLCNVKLETYHGALVIDLRILDCSRWMILCGTALHSPRIVYRTSTQILERICIREVCFQEKNLIYVPGACTCLTVLNLSGDDSFWYVCARWDVDRGSILDI